MKDIDFDELDRAVNSLIGPKTPDAKPEVPPTTPTPASTSPVAPPPTSTAADNSAPAAAPLAARRSSGRFMDVVHPSSDMRTSPVPPRPAAHTETTITPPSSTSPTPEPAPKVEESKEPETTSAPMDMPATPPVEDTPSPLESPFLSDAKVEKRPLGAFSNSNETPAPAPATPLAETPKPEAGDVSVDQKPENKTDHPMGTDTPLPAELQDNLLSIEASEDTEPKKDDTTPIPTVTMPIGSTSIPAQYTEQPSTGDQPTGAVFDTEAYKKPMAHPKKKSGWLIVVWILLLLVVGAGVGAAIYFFVLPKL